MKTFEKEISFLSKTFNSADNGGNNEWEDKLVKKIATFKELSRTAKDQHKLHFKIISLFSDNSKKGENSISLDTDVVYDLTTIFVEKCLVLNEVFTVQDKEEFLQDSGALFQFGMAILGEKITPFFSVLMGKAE